jgi:tetratricopeptide (TPR) repeat protein
MDSRLAANPDDSEARIHRGWLALLEARPADAFRDLDRPSLRHDPDVERMLVEGFERSNNLPGLQRVLDRQIERNPRDTDAHYRRGLLGLELGQFARAAEDFDKVLAARPEFDHAHYTRIQCLIRIGRDREAVAELDAFTPKYSNDWVIYHLRAIARANLGEIELSRADAEKARALLPKDPGTLNSEAWGGNLARPLGRRDPERAVVLARRAVELAPDNWFCINSLGVALYRTARLDEAVSVLEKALILGKGDWDGFDVFFLAMAHARLGHAQRGHDCFDRAIRWVESRKDLSPDRVAELAAFRSEAEAILHASGGELPADVFAHH